MTDSRNTEPRERVELPIFDPDFKSNPYAWYDASRDAGRTVIPVRLPSGVEAWLVTSYAAARQMMNDPRLCKDAANVGREDPEPAPRPAEYRSHPIFRHLLTLDPPDHTRLRSLVAREFSTRRIQRMRHEIEEIAARLLDHIVPQGEADLLQGFALPFPLDVICRLLGVPSGDEPRVQRWAALLLAADMDEPHQVPAIAQEMHDYLLELARAKRAAPDDSILSALLPAHAGGNLTEQELTAMGFLLLVAGHETTANLIGNGVVALLRHPSQWARLCAGEEVTAVVVEELLRFDSPLEMATARFARTDIVIDDVRIHSGDMVFIGLGAANRDPRQFANPGRLDFQRNASEGHLAFGHGIHYCLGAPLARIEAEIALTRLARRCPDLELSCSADDLRWKPGLIMRGLESLPVRFNRDA